MPFNPTAQTAKNTSIVICCNECGKWRSVHSELKLKKEVKVAIAADLENISYSCGSTFQDISSEVYETFLEVFVCGNLTCQDNIEMTY